MKSTVSRLLSKRARLSCQWRLDLVFLLLSVAIYSLSPTTLHQLSDFLEFRWELAQLVDRADDISNIAWNRMRIIMIAETLFGSGRFLTCWLLAQGSYANFTPLNQCHAHNTLRNVSKSLVVFLFCCSVDEDIIHWAHCRAPDMKVLWLWMNVIRSKDLGVIIIQSLHLKRWNHLNWARVLSTARCVSFFKSFKWWDLFLWSSWDDEFDIQTCQSSA